MGKIKIHEIAKKLGLASKDVLERAKKLGIDAKSHLSSIDEVDAKKIEESIHKKEKKSETAQKEVKAIIAEHFGIPETKVAVLKYSYMIITDDDEEKKEDK